MFGFFGESKKIKEASDGVVLVLNSVLTNTFIDQLPKKNIFEHHEEVIKNRYLLGYIAGAATVPAKYLG